MSDVPVAPPGYRISREDREFTNELLNHWKPIFFMDQYTVHLYFHDNPRAPEENSTLPVNDPSASAVVSCAIADRYHQFSIDLYPKFFEHTDREDQEEMFVHELMHVPVEIMSEMLHRAQQGVLVTREEHRNSCERVVDWVKNVVMRAANRTTYMSTVQKAEKPLDTETKEISDGSDRDDIHIDIPETNETTENEGD